MFQDLLAFELAERVLSEHLERLFLLVVEVFKQRLADSLALTVLPYLRHLQRKLVGVCELLQLLVSQSVLDL